jgi:hypothetical protein
MFIFWASARAPGSTIPKIKAAADRPIPIIGLFPPQLLSGRTEPRCTER